MFTSFPEITEDIFDDVDAVFILSSRKGTEQNEDCRTWRAGQDKWCPAQELVHKNAQINRAMQIAEARNIKYV